MRSHKERIAERKKFDLSDKSLNKIKNLIEEAQFICADEIDAMESLPEDEVDENRHAGLYHIASVLSRVICDVFEVDKGINPIDFDRDIARLEQARDDFEKAKERLKN